MADQAGPAQQAAAQRGGTQQHRRAVVRRPGQQHRLDRGCRCCRAVPRTPA
jgi:hypothetical protein